MKVITKIDQDKATYYQPQGEEVALFTHAWQQQLPVLLKGPTGCGKTRFVQHMADKLGKKLYTVACHDDLSAADLIGRHLIGSDGTYWQDGPLTRAVREGAICYLDEVVEARKDTTVVIHPLTDDRRILPIDRTGEIIKAASGFMLVVSYNPGYQNLLKGMKPSTRQRFVAMRFDYPDAATEVKIVAKESGCDICLATELVTIAGHLRQLKDHDLEESASTRLLIYTAQLIQHGLAVTEACRAALIEPLTDDEETVSALMRVVEAKFVTE
ncbi:CbbQ/NirQ/NorQ/GpvN family protein [Marinicella sp. S1101]|uniref:CbbQ/NirQ/NorQ/GpvN family protein n=1 Tax=Marinicella marina TaxID=2996016 RepID=UPI002260AAF8|nr:CbbQ/NirQ/NorQ/GpvN family protein [Marinicella marina]MCX7552444.1 CbbQ/NirQ/NorQ/GpvN family protein [Marinicella marina]MDJ1139319.1 CbbQ/NirQ/NorQ/GpvN family protein [Marinicella marina]